MAQRRNHTRLNASQFARYLGLHVRTPMRWIARGLLKAVRCGDRRSQWRIKLGDAKRFLRNPPKQQGVARIVRDCLASHGAKYTGKGRR